MRSSRGMSTASLLFVVGAYLVSRWLTSDDGDVLMDFLRQKLEADEAEP